jgi:hypothetical protein
MCETLSSISSTTKTKKKKKKEHLILYKNLGVLGFYGPVLELAMKGILTFVILGKVQLDQGSSIKFLENT